MYNIKKYSDIVFGYDISDVDNFEKFKGTVLELATSMYNDLNAGYESVDDAVYSLIDNFDYDALDVERGKIDIKELVEIWSPF